MDCETLARYLDLYLDGELALEERAEVEAHLKGCPGCQEAAAAEVRFRTGLRQALLSARAPASLREQVSRRLQQEVSAAGNARFLPALLAAAAVLMIAVVGYGVLALWTVPEDPVQDVVEAHRVSSDSEVFGDRDQVLGFLRAHAPFRFRVPVPDGEDARLVGARVTRFGASPAVVYLYDVGGRRVTIAQYPAPDTGPGPGLRLDRRAGFVVATYGDQGLTQTVVSDLPDREVRRFLPASYQGP